MGIANLFEIAEGRNTRRRQFKISIPVCRSEVRRRSNGVRCVMVWNSLPGSVVGCGSVEGLDLFLGDSLYS